LNRFICRSRRRVGWCGKRLQASDLATIANAKAGISVALGIIVSDGKGIGAATSAAVDAEVPASVALLDAYKCATRDDVELVVSHFDWL